MILQTYFKLTEVIFGRILIPGCVPLRRTPRVITGDRVKVMRVVLLRMFSGEVGELVVACVEVLESG